MTAKRQATSQLTQENWDQEDEDSGEINTFNVASKEVLERRIIKRGRRRKLQTSGEEENKSSIFSGFSGFGKSTTATSKGFDFLAKLTNGSGDPPKSNGFAMSTNAEVKPAASDATPASTSNPDTTPEISDEYFAKLKGLNESVSKWIKSHVDKDPFCLLTPIFQDYEKYLKDIEKIRYKNSTETAANKTSIFTSSISENKLTTVTSKSNDSDVTERDRNVQSTSLSSASPMIIPGFASSASSTPFSFGDRKTVPQQTSMPSPPFSFGGFKPATPATASNPLTFGSSSTPFSFGGGKPFTFASDNKVEEANQSQEPKTNEDEDEPPKVEFTPVVEENSVFETKCKIFVKSQGNFGDRGVGTLYIKPIDNSEKYQLIVRANTNLGNLLLNLVLNASMPLQRMGKNNVMIVCIPTTESKPPPVPVLIRVKTSEEADNLLDTLKKFTK